MCTPDDKLGKSDMWPSTLRPMWVTAGLYHWVKIRISWFVVTKRAPLVQLLTMAGGIFICDVIILILHRDTVIYQNMCIYCICIYFLICHHVLPWHMISILSQTICVVVEADVAKSFHICKVKVPLAIIVKGFIRVVKGIRLVSCRPVVTCTLFIYYRIYIVKPINECPPNLTITVSAYVLPLLGAQCRKPICLKMNFIYVYLNFFFEHFLSFPS